MVRGDRYMGRLRERVAHSWQFKSLAVAFLSGFLWPVILIGLVQSPDLHT